jgi:metal-dependent amidase/aminoacylase/carboxypeptidase family protein
VNDPITAQKILKVAEKLFSPDKIDQNFRTMGAEDFAYFLEKVPGCFIFVGSANEEKGLNQGHHHPRFDFDEDVLPTASALMAMSAWKLLK